MSPAPSIRHYASAAQDLALESVVSLGSMGKYLVQIGRDFVRQLGGSSNSNACWPPRNTPTSLEAGGEVGIASTDLAARQVHVWLVVRRGIYRGRIRTPDEALGAISPTHGMKV